VNPKNLRVGKLISITMKKSLLLFGAIVCMITLTYAQDETKPTGKFAVDLTFDPAAIFDASAGSMFNMPMIKARYFISSDFALRMGLDVDFSSSKDYADVDGNDYTKSSSHYEMFAIGAEKHLSTGRFSPYIGGDIAISNYTTKSKTSIGGTTIESKNPTGGYIRLGLYAAIGSDFYLLPNFYIGVEFSPGYSLSLSKDQKVDGTVTDKGGTSTNFNLSSASGLRVGFRF
jgi:hypothetical protein